MNAVAPPSLLTRLFDLPIAVVDVETTGASPAYGHRVMEVGIVRVERGQSVCYQQLIDPRRPIGAGAAAVTGISQQMVDGQPRFDEQAGRVMSLLRDAVVVGHNVRFDLMFLASEFRRVGIDLSTVFSASAVLDTVRIARRRFGRGGNGLQRLSRRLGIVPSVAHRALADAETTSAVLKEMLVPMGGWSMCLCDVLGLQGGSLRVNLSRPASVLPLELAEALELSRPVEMEYLDARQRRSRRVVTPTGVRKHRGELTLVAHCELRNDRRYFKVDRIAALQRIETEVQERSARLFTDSR